MGCQGLEEKIYLRRSEKFSFFVGENFRGALQAYVRSFCKLDEISFSKFGPNLTTSTADCYVTVFCYAYVFMLCQWYPNLL